MNTSEHSFRACIRCSLVAVAIGFSNMASSETPTENDLLAELTEAIHNRDLSEVSRFSYKLDSDGVEAFRVIVEGLPLVRSGKTSFITL